MSKMPKMPGARRSSVTVSYTHLEVYKRQGKGIVGHLYCVGKTHARLFHQQAQQLGNGHCGVGIVEPVSYTHLDVYKRQQP